jgi:hypothetical protein
VVFIADSRVRSVARRVAILHRTKTRHAGMNCARDAAGRRVGSISKGKSIDTVSNRSFRNSHRAPSGCGATLHFGGHKRPMHYEIIWIVLSGSFPPFPFSALPAQIERTIHTVWDEFSRTTNSATNTNPPSRPIFTANKVPSRQFYSVQSVENLEAADEFRVAADKIRRDEASD